MFSRAAFPALFIALFFSCEALCQEEAHEKTKGLLATGDFQEALEAAEEVIAQDPEDPRGYHLKGEALSGLNRWDVAVEAFETALGKAPPGLEFEENAVRSIRTALYRQAVDRFDSGEPLAAIDSLDDALLWDVDFLEGILFRGAILEGLGRTEEAQEEFQIALRKAPSHPEALTHAARFHIRLHRYDEALPYLDRLFLGTDPPASDPALAWGYLTSAKIRLERGERVLAHKHLARAFELDPADEEVKRLFTELESFRVQAGKVVRAERWLLFASILTLLVYLGGGALSFRFLKKKGLL